MKRGLIKEFQTIVGRENLFTEEADLAAYSYDAAVVKPVMPGIVVRPTHVHDIGSIIKICNHHKIPLTVRGSGTNLSGGTVPAPGGVVLLTNGLNNIHEINQEDMYAIVEPGVITANFAAAVEKKGLFYPPDPASQSVSTLGGNISENAGGLRGLKYGVTRDYVMGLEFFDAEGELIKTGARTVKCVTGYNLTSIMVGSEGTLGVISKIILKLIPLPKHRKSMMAIFDDIYKGSETVARIIAERIVPATLEFLDQFTIKAVEEYSHAGLPVEAQALLLIEVDGHPAQIEEEAQIIQKICRKMGAREIWLARNLKERDKIWEARRSALSALAKLRPTVILEDATVPRSKIPKMIEAIQNISKKFDLPIGTFGHAGDGNLHPTVLTDRRNKEEWNRAEKAIEAIFERAIELGGTLSGEHGIGLAKAPFLKDELTPGTLKYYHRLKSALDPNRILNPGKIIGE